MIKVSRNNLKYQNVQSPPEHTANGNVYGYFATGYYCIRTWHSKHFSVGLIVGPWFNGAFCHGLVYFLKIEIKKLLNPPKLSCGFKWFLYLYLFSFVCEHDYGSYCLAIDIVLVVLCACGE